MNFRHPLILASKSPRRQWLLKEAGFDFEIRTKETEEDYDPAMPVRQVPMYLAEKKAIDLLTDVPGGSLVIAADTVVILENSILGKPKDLDEARWMLGQMSGKAHQVVTGVCLLSEQKKVLFDDLTEVYFKKISSEEIKWYVEKYQPLDKAGAYGAQEWIGMVAIERLVGSYFNVMGLPVHRLYDELLRF